MAIFTKLPKFLFLFFYLLILISMFIACQCECDREKENNNPYLFESHMFKSRFESKHGEFRVLDKFTQLLLGIENYRIGVLEFEPRSFLLPHHFDAQLLLLIVRGTSILFVSIYVILFERSIRNLHYNPPFRLKLNIIKLVTYFVHKIIMCDITFDQCVYLFNFI